jgi:hypothetical protein
VRFTLIAHGRKASRSRLSKALLRLARIHAAKCGRYTPLSDYR